MNIVFKVAILFAASQFATLFGQSTAHLSNGLAVIQGTIRTIDGDLQIGGVQFAFLRNGKVIETAGNLNGTYRVTVPPGLYSMRITDRSPERFQTYQRPVFLVTSGARLTLNAKLAGTVFCDTGGSVAPAVGASQNEPICGGAHDSFSLPSSDGIPFELVIRYQSRKSIGSGFVYNIGRPSPFYDPPHNPLVDVAYNLFTLEGDHVTYHEKDRTLAASGNVVAPGPFPRSRAHDAEGWNRSCSNKWAAKQENSSRWDGAFLDFSLYRTTRELVALATEKL